MTFLSGMALGLSLIIAIGAQNVFVLRQGLRKEHVGLAVAICAASDARWAFGTGAIVGSIVWFTALGYGARLLSGLLAKPGAWRVLDAVIAVIMVALAVMLAAGA